MNALADTIRSNALEIETLHKRIDSTCENRSRSRSDLEAWSRACSEFHKRFADLAWPGGSARWGAFLARDSSELESAITFLEVDPIFFRSGYMKQYIWNRLKRASLAAVQQKRVESSATAYLHRWVNREFWDMVRYVRFCGSEVFWLHMSELATVSGSPTSIKANWLIWARMNYPVRQWLNRERLRSEYQKGYVPDLSFRRQRGA